MALDLTKGKSTNMIKDIASKSSGESNKKTTRNIDVSLIDKSDDNEKIFSMGNRERLTNAIARNGFQGTVQVYLKKDGRYALLSGHRRFESAKELGFKEIPCEIIEEPSETQKAEILIMSNVVARDLSPVEKGRAIKYYETHVLEKDGFKGDRRAELAKRFGIASSQIYKLKALADIIKPLQDLVEQNEISYASIYLCSNLSEDVQTDIYKEIINHINKYGSIIGKDVEYIVKAHTQEQTNVEAAIKDDVLDDNNSIEQINSPLFGTDNKKTVDTNEFASSRTKQASMPYDEVRISSNAKNLYQLLNDIKEIKSDAVVEGLKALRELLNKMEL